MFHTELVELLQICTRQFDVLFCVVAVAWNFEEPRAYVNFRCFHAKNGKKKLS